jgi:hypothetical protein
VPHERAPIRARWRLLGGAEAKTSSVSDEPNDCSVASREDLEATIHDLQEQVDRLEELIGENVAGLHDRISGYEHHLEAVERRIDDLENDAKVARATSSSKKQSKVEKATEVLEAADRKQGGPAGVTIDTGEVIVAAKCSRSRATGLMDEIAGATDDAKTRTPGGPNPKALRLPIGGDRDVDELIDELVNAWGGEEDSE